MISLSIMFYRIGVAEGSVPEPILSEIQEESETGSDGRVAAVSSANEPGGNLRNQSVITNNPNYGFLDAQDDLYAIRKWAQDLDQLVSKENRNETLMALFNAASRYYPDVDTKVVVRIMLADIKADNAESHGNASADASAKSSSSASAHAFSVDSYGTSLTALEKMLKGKNAQKVSFATALGSWVAGPSEDDGGYMTAGDDISAQYFAHIAEGLSVMYTGSTAQKHKYGKDWLDSIELTPGLVDYAK
ncbi:hypothetical protein MOBT1_002890 [Malassezia obtusa]|uniref:Uncharacterized protein n=1 Tax=Malassezia obtusa TaxID=76774 RepID=A0AAF0E2S9_9BASI|nr:hypothetical protein MOBT1_002890 [Malassezia obtusa]